MHDIGAALDQDVSRFHQLLAIFQNRIHFAEQDNRVVDGICYVQLRDAATCRRHGVRRYWKDRVRCGANRTLAFPDPVALAGCP